MEAINSGPYPTVQAAAEAISRAVVEADSATRWIILADAGVGRAPICYGTYSSAEIARKAIERGYIYATGNRGVMVVPMKPSPRKGSK